MNIILLVAALIMMIPQASAQETATLQKLCEAPYTTLTNCGDVLARIPTGGYMSQKLGYGMRISDASTNVYDKNGTLLGGCGGMGALSQDKVLCTNMSQCKPEDLCVGIPARCPPHDALCEDWNETVRKVVEQRKQ